VWFYRFPAALGIARQPARLAGTRLLRHRFVHLQPAPRSESAHRTPENGIRRRLLHAAPCGARCTGPRGSARRRARIIRMNNIWLTEELHSYYRKSLRVKRVLVEEQTDFQFLQVVETEFFGNALVLDGIIQLTERDNMGYHEMIT